MHHHSDSHRACYTNDRLEAFRFKTGIKAGMTGINNSTTGAEAHLPFGGVKGSGNGSRESGIWVIESYSYWHAVNDEFLGSYSWHRWMSKR